MGWFFGTKRDDSKLEARVDELGQQFRELDQRFKVIEREHEDLHRAYRRLRASSAAEARDASRSSPQHRPSGNGEDSPRAPETKEELRRRYLRRELPLQTP